MLDYGVFGDILDEYMCTSELTCLDSMYKIYRAVIEVFGDVYLTYNQIWNMEVTQRLLSIN
jgi:hypothetical protein